MRTFLSDLATVGKVAAATQNQALSALLFLYREVLQVDLPWMDGVVRAKRPKHVPVVLTENEVRALLAHLEGTRWLVVSLLYSSGARLLEGLRLRVKDVDFERHEITVRDGKGARDRVTMLHERDLTQGFGEVHLPFALARKYPKAGRSWMALSVAIIWTRRSCSVRWRARRVPLGFRSRFRHMCRDILSPPTCSLRATTSARCRSCSATRTCPRR